MRNIASRCWAIFSIESFVKEKNLEQEWKKREKFRLINKLNEMTEENAPFSLAGI